MTGLATKALILDGHSRAAVEATQSLGRAGVEVFVASSLPEPIAFSSRYARHRLQQPPAAPVEELLDWLRQAHSQHGFQLIIPSTEDSLQAFLALPDEHPLRRRAVLPSGTALACALDRGMTCNLAASLGVPIPATRVIETLPEEPQARSFPLVLKPVRSKCFDKGELRTYSPAVIRDAAAYSSVLRDWIPHMVVLEQEYVPGWGIGIECLYVEGKLQWYFAHERLHEWPMTGGASTYRRAIEPPEEMLRAARLILDRLEWHGVAMVEFKRRHDGSFALMEINPRLWGSLALTIDAGADFPLALWKMACGEAPPAQPAYRRGLRTRHLSTDLAWQKANLLADHGNPLLLTRSRIISLLEPALVLTGAERWDHFQWTDLGPTFHECARMIRAALHWRRRRRQRRSFLRNRRQMLQQAAARIASARSTRAPSIVFLCHGNICRSPFAAMAANANLPGYRVSSAGFDGHVDRPTPPNVSEQAAGLGFDMSCCRSVQVTNDLLSCADLILYMDLDQYVRLVRRFPEHLERAVPLGLLADPPAVEIEDPNHKDAATTRRVLLQILSAVERLAYIFGSRAGSGTRPDGRSKYAA